MIPKNQMKAMIPKNGVRWPPRPCETTDTATMKTPANANARW